MRIALLGLGILAVLMGSLWVGQGAGWVHWPASSFMLDQRPWIARGAALAVVGAVLIAVALVLGRGSSSRP
jgi:negative regulator of sigma E activity